MKRKLAILLTLGLILGVVGCEKSGNTNSTEAVDNTVSEETTTERPEEEQLEPGTESGTNQEEVVEKPEERKVFITYDRKNDDRYNENGDLILSVYYELPVVTVDGNEEASNTINQELESDEEMFFINCDSMETEAAMMFEDGLIEDIPAFANEVRFSEKRVDNKIISLVKNNYSYAGGAHGSSFFSGWNFDAETGKRLTIGDIAEDRDAFMAQVKEYVLDLCESDAYNSRLFPEYQEYIDFVLQDDLWFLDYEGITFIANTYEIASYAEGVIYFKIPYSELEGLKAEYAYDGGFQKSVNLGESISVDISGDGNADEITFACEESSDYVYVPKLIINGVDYSEVFEDNQCYFAYPYEKYVILDIDENDSTMEIAVQDYGMSDDPMTAFLRYDGNQVTYLGEIFDRVSDMYIVNEGNGNLHARERMNVFETAQVKVIYQIVDGKLQRDMKDLYPVVQYSAFSADSSKILLQDFVVYEDMSMESTQVTLKKGDKITVVATDDVEWMQMKDANDNVYYIHIVNGFQVEVNGEEVYTSDVFDPILMAG